MENISVSKELNHSYSGVGDFYESLVSQFQSEANLDRKTLSEIHEMVAQITYAVQGDNLPGELLVQMSEDLSGLECPLNH